MRGNGDQIMWAFPLLAMATLGLLIVGSIGGAAAIEAYSVPHWLAFIVLCTVSATIAVFWLFAFGWMCTGYWGAFWSAIRGKTLDGGDL